jgi:hypothetical protein
MTVAGLIAVVCWNVAAYTSKVFSLRNASSEVAGFEKLWEPFQAYLTTVDYRIGDLGFVSSTSLAGGGITEEENIHRSQLYYVVIPLNLVPNKLDAPYIVADFLRTRPGTLPPGFVEVYDPGNGLVLLKSTRDK